MNLFISFTEALTEKYRWKGHELLAKYFGKYRQQFRTGLKFLLFLGYNVYLGFAIAHHLSLDKEDIGWCNGLGFLLITTAVVYISIGSKFIVTRIPIKVKRPLEDSWSKASNAVSEQRIQIGLYSLVLLAIAVFLVVDTAGNRTRLISASGVVILILLGALFSKHRR